MSYAPDYAPGTSFADDETNNVAGRSLVKADRLDSELADISASINALNANQQTLQRDDGKLADSLVEPYALSEQTRALIAVAGCTPRGTWQTNTDYYYKDVIQRSNIAQICIKQEPHNSGSTFTQSFWLPISGDGTSAANAAAAAASAASALSSQVSSAASETASVTSAAEATTAKINAETAATNALNSALSAATSKSNAEDRASEAAASAASAAASAASINAPKNATNDSTFASTSDEDPVSPEWVNGRFSELMSGIVFDWPGSTAPPGAMALPLVPTNVSRTTYSKWFARYGTQFGSGDGSTTFGMPYCPENFALIQANGNVGSSSNGQMPAHSHSLPNQPSDTAGSFFSMRSSTGPSSTTSSGVTGSGSNNLAAGIRMLKCIWL